MFESINKLSRRKKKILLVSVDFIALPLAFWAGYVLRLGEWWPESINNAWWVFIAAPLVSIPVFVRMGLYRAVLRYVGTKALITIAKAITITTLILLALVVATQTHGIPRSVFLIFWLLSLIFLAGSRLILREYLQSISRRHVPKQPVAIYGAGSSGAELARALQVGWEYAPVAFVDDNVELQGSEIHGIKVHPAKHLPQLIDGLGISQILLAMPSLSPAQRQRVLQRIETLPVHVLTLPAMADLVAGRAKISDIREVDIGDILGREVVPPIPELLGQCIRGKSVMVTGAGGSIGSELCRQIVACEPTRLVLFEQSEFALYKIEQELQAFSARVEIIPVLGSVTDRTRVQAVMEACAIQTIYHAAAYKHVPLVEKNPAEGLRNNVFGTWHTAQAAQAVGVETFVFISTDKAVRPTNKMGATKRLAELVLQGMAASDSPTRFTMVRFGNVLGSSGSVIPLFRQQIRQGGPVTVTHPDVTRYFMTIPEAAQLVLQAGAMGQGGDVFVLDMGEPIKIDDLARRMIHLSGLDVVSEDNLEGDIAIEYSGLRPGEKLYEELLIGDNVQETQHPKIMRAAEEMISWEQLQGYLRRLDVACRDFDTPELRRLLAEIVRGYSPDDIIADVVWCRRDEGLGSGSDAVGGDSAND